MHKVLAFAVLTALASPVLPQQKPPTLAVRHADDRTNVFLHRGSEVELFPAQRATPTYVTSEGKQLTSVHQEVASRPFSEFSLGVVFNYATQQYGTASGEIAFMLKGRASLSDIAVSAGLRPKRIMASGVYVVTASTPQQFLDTVKMLEKSAAVSWAEPTIQYGRVQVPATLR